MKISKYIKIKKHCCPIRSNASMAHPGTAGHSLKLALAVCSNER